MKTLKPFLLILGSASLLFLGACSSNGNQANTPANSSPVANSSPASNATESSPAANSSTAHPETKAAGGMVVESGPYHLELVPAKEADSMHLDFFLQKGDNHEAIPNAKVVAQVQLPDGTQKNLDLKYDASGKHYTAQLPGAASGEYKVAISSEIGGEKVNGRFAFKQ